MMLESGNLRISLTPAGVRVIDGKGTINAKVGKGRVTYLRSATGGLLFHNDSIVGEHYFPSNEVLDTTSIQGVGNVKGVLVYSTELTNEQVMMLGYLPLFKEGDY